MITVLTTTIHLHESIKGGIHDDHVTVAAITTKKFFLKKQHNLSVITINSSKTLIRISHIYKQTDLTVIIIVQVVN